MNGRIASNLSRVTVEGVFAVRTLIPGAGSDNAKALYGLWRAAAENGRLRHPPTQEY